MLEKQRAREALPFYAVAHDGISSAEGRSCQAGHKDRQRTVPALQNATASPSLCRVWAQQLLVAIPSLKYSSE